MAKKAKGRPAKKARSRSIAKPDPIADQKLLDTIGGPDNALRPDGHLVSGTVDLSPPGEAETRAAEKADAETARPQDAKPEAVPSLPSEAEAFLKPGAVTSLIETINVRLIEKRSPWAASKREAHDIGEAIERVADKYFPSASEWSPEAILAILLLIYAIPRVPAAVARKRAAAIAAGAERERSTEKPKDQPKPRPVSDADIESDPRLEPYVA